MLSSVEFSTGIPLLCVIIKRDNRTDSRYIITTHNATKQSLEMEHVTHGREENCREDCG